MSKSRTEQMDENRRNIIANYPSRHDPDYDDNDGSFDYLPPREHDMRAFGRVIEDESTVGFPVQGGECVTRTGHFTGQVICTACGADCEHYLCTHEDDPNDDEHAHDTTVWAKQWNPALYQKILEDQEDRSMKLTPREVTQLETALDEDQVNHDTVQEQTGEDR
jgi:hypothetical protein